MKAVYECVDCEKVEVITAPFVDRALPKAIHMDHDTKKLFIDGHKQIPAWGKLWCPHLLVRRK